MNYEKEYDKNLKYLTTAAKFFFSSLKNNQLISDDDNFDDMLSDIRAAETVNSCTEDILRYASYHHIKSGSDGTIDLSPATRAAFFTKWIMMFRPITLDTKYIVSSDVIISVLESLRTEVCESDSLESNSSLYGTDQDITRIFLCNELFSIHLADVILRLGCSKKPDSVFRVVAGKEMRSLMYGLRFRVKHQDSFSLFFNRIMNESRSPTASLLSQ